MKLAELERNSYWDYATWRKKTHQGTRDVTIQNEQSTINNMMAYSYREGLSHLPKLAFQPLRIDKEIEKHRRGVFTLQEYDQLARYMRTYASKEINKGDESQRLERLLIRDCVLLSSNTMLRPGEIRNVKWGDITGYKKTKDSLGRDCMLVSLTIRHEISKTGRQRKVTSLGGQYFQRLKDRSKYTSPGDYIFTSVGGTRRLPRQKYYQHWQNLMEGIGLAYKSRNVTWYSLRHFGITCRLRAQVSIYEVAELAGTSVVHIQEHYGHMDEEMRAKAALKNFTYDRTGIVELNE